MTRDQQIHGVVMKRKMASASATLALSAFAVLGLLGCTTDVNGALVIVQNQIPETLMGMCLVPAKRDAIRRITGTYDVDLDKDYPYFMFPLVLNALPASAQQGQIEPNRVEYMGVEVKIQPPAGVDFPSSEACPSEFKFDERASMDPGREIGSMVQVFLPCHAKLLRDMFLVQKVLPADFSSFVRFQVSVRAVGSHAGTTIKSDPFEFVIRVCAGCLQRGFEREFARFDYPSGIPACSALKANPYMGNACNPGQDALILCCGLPDGKLDCPGRGTAP